MVDQMTVSKRTSYPLPTTNRKLTHGKFISDDWELPKFSLKHPCRQTSDIKMETMKENINKMFFKNLKTVLEYRKITWEDFVLENSLKCLFLNTPWMISIFTSIFTMPDKDEREEDRNVNVWNREGKPDVLREFVFYIMRAPGINSPTHKSLSVSLNYVYM